MLQKIIEYPKKFIQNIHNEIHYALEDRELDEFEKLVVNCRRKNIGRYIDQASTPHGLFASEELLYLAYENKLPIKIISSRFNPEFYEQLEDKFSQCMDNGCEIKAILLHPKIDTKDNKLVNTIKNHSKGYFKQNIDKNKIATPNFLLVGDKSFRFEIHKGQSNINFNSEPMGLHLLLLFNKLYKSIPENYYKPLVI